MTSSPQEKIYAGKGKIESDRGREREETRTACTSNDIAGIIVPVT